MQFLKTLLDLVFPPRCQACRAISEELLCEECLARINYLEPSAFVHAVGVYEGPLKKAIWRFKFDNKPELAAPLGKLMARYLEQHLNTKELDLFIPVPLHEKKKRQRGYNQAELLSLELTKALDLPTISGLLFRTRETHHQFDLPRAERYHNVKDAFQVKGAALLVGKKVLLVDDIYTTGSTIAECTRALKEAGAEKIHVLTLSCALEG